MVDKSIRDLDQSRLGPILTGDREALKSGPPVTAMLVQNTNPQRRRRRRRRRRDVTTTTT